MLKRIITLFKLGRKVAQSDILNITSKFQEPPLVVKFLFKILSFSFSPKAEIEMNKNEGERLSNSLESMGTTFIKLGQFLATRPDIIGEELSKKLENLQDKLPPFSLIQAKEIIKNDLGNDTYNSIIDLSEPVAAASIAQVHKAKINDGGTIKDVAIKILRPDIKKIFKLFCIRGNLCFVVLLLPLRNSYPNFKTIRGYLLRCLKDLCCKSSSIFNGATIFIRS